VGAPTTHTHRDNDDEHHSIRKHLLDYWRAEAPRVGAPRPDDAEARAHRRAGLGAGRAVRLGRSRSNAAAAFRRRHYSSRQYTTHLAQGAPVDALDPPMLVLDFDTIFSLGAARSWSAHLEAVSALPPGLPSVGEQLYSMRSDVCGLFNRLVDLGDNPEGCSNERMQEMANAAHDLGRQWSASWISRSDACALHAAQVVSALNWGAPAHEEPAAGGLATPPAELVHTPDAAVGISLNECVTEPAVPVRCTPLESHRQGLTMVGQARHRSPRRDPAPGPSHLPLFTGIGSADEEHATTLEVSHPNMLVCDLLPDQISGHVDMSRLVAVVVPRSGPRFRSEQLRSYSIR
jgi:hypothetical protein